ncbi:hypothetical protein [Nitrosopumilus adriaticus]|uniref:Uncharacterized protein n=1 Tax=Nitrosopumilus adriaticus TaxID=1580092 RepID=A0A0D5C2F1_9ARCH|nr:hypothetical protein [Nitrosopumilus adriaticus]AJW70748.1 hypothetical protein NADRNF5_1058 [Nitrosopumilus adriaticus]
MAVNGKLDTNYLAITELTSEINSIARRSFDGGNKELSPSDVEHILRITSDVVSKIRPQLKEITV